MPPSKLGPPPPPSSAAASRSMRGNAAKNTTPELQLRAMLRAAGYSGYRLHWRKVPGRPDIAYPGRRIAVFVNGCFWHRCPKCQPSTPKSNTEFWERKFELNAERDARKVREIEAAGWTVLTVWECEIRSGDALGPILDALGRD
jgi:DNA mismatch endonuclease Vsr